MDYLKESIANQQKVLDEIERSSALLSDSLRNATDNMNGKDKNTLLNLEKDLKNVLNLAKSGGDTTLLISEIKHKYGVKNNK